jgi:hypothetical protein
MNTMTNALRKAGVENRRSVEIRDIYTRTMATAKRKQASASARGLATTLAGRIAKAKANAWEPHKAEAPVYQPHHYNNTGPWERLAEVVAATSAL